MAVPVPGNPAAGDLHGHLLARPGPGVLPRHSESASVFGDVTGARTFAFPGQAASPQGAAVTQATASPG